MTASASARIRPRPRVTESIDAFVGEVRDVVGRGLAPDPTARLVGERLVPYLGAPDLLTEAQCEGDPGRYRQHLLHAEPDGSFSVDRKSVV